MDPQGISDNPGAIPQSVAERVINVHTTKEYDWVLRNIFSEEKCGQRNRTLFWKSDKPGSCHFFIEFAHKESVPIAQREAGQGVTVHCLSRNMNMFGIFACLARGIEPPKKRTATDAEGSQAGDPSVPSRSPTANGPSSAKRQRTLYDNEPARRTSPPPNYREVPYKPLRQTTNPYSQNSRDIRDIPQRDFTFNPKPKPSWNNTVNTERRYQNNYNNNNPSYQKPRYRNNDLHSSNGSVSPPRRPREDSLNYGNRDDDDNPPRRDRNTSPRRRVSDASTRRLSDASSKRPTEPSFRRPTNNSLPPSPDAYDPSSPQFSTSAQIPTINPFSSSDLDSSLSDDNIGAVIDSLKLSLSGPESWMTVAAHYRRRNNYKNALAVVASMIDVMRDRGMVRSELRPALLLMAQCHYSLGKQEKQELDSLDASNKHFVLLLDWLRETYGPNTPAMDAIAQSGLRSPWTVEKDPRSFLPQNPYGDPLQRMPFQTSVPGLFETHSSAPARLDAVSAENARLRENHSATAAELVAARAALQKAENASRATEAKLQCALEDERNVANRLLRETDARRRTEERLVQERTSWERRTEEIRDEGARGAVRELSTILSLTARAPTTMLEATRVFCEARGRLERDASVAP